VLKNHTVVLKKIIYKAFQKHCLSTIKLVFYGYFLGIGVVQAQSDAEYIVDIQRSSVSNGLSHNHVYQTFQDSRGFIWFVTATGLDFYDANVIYRVMEWPMLSSSNAARISLEDIDGDLWLRFIDVGKVSYRLVNIYSRQVQSIASKFGDKFQYDLFDAALGKGGTILTSDIFGVIRETETDGTCKQRYVSTEGPLWFCSQTNSKNNIWLKQATSRFGQVFLSIGTHGELLAKYEEPNPVNFMVTNDEALWALGDFYVTAVQPEGQVERRLIRDVFPEYDNYSAYTTDAVANSNSSGKFWLFNKKQLFVWHPTFGLIYDFADYKGIDKPYEAFDIMVDKNNIVWLSTINGSYRISLRKTRFKKLLWQDPLLKHNVFMNSCRGILHPNNGMLYVNMLTNTYCIDLKSSETKKILNFASGTYGLADTKDGSLLIGMEQIAHLDLLSGLITKNLNLHKGVCWSIFPHAGNIWIGFERGLVKINSSSEQVEVFEAFNGFEALKTVDIYHIQLKPEGDGLWLLTNNGLYQLDFNKGIVARYWKGGSGQYYLPADNIRHCYIDKEGVYWFATSEGLMRWDPVKSVSRLYTIADGLPHNNLYAVYPDAFGFLWMSSDNGIVQFKLSTEKCRYFQTQDGITHNEFNRISHCQAEDGTLYFGGLNGITSFDPKDFQSDFDKESGIAVYLTRAILYSETSDQEIDILKDYYKNNKIFYRHSDRFLNLQFGVAGFFQPGQVTYSYKIEGLREKWVSSKSADFQLAGLPYGKHTLIIRVKTPNGDYSKDCRIEIDVPKPFYLQFGFLLLGALLVCVLVYVFFQYRVKLLRQRQLELEMEVASRTRKISQDKKLIEQQSERLERLAEEKSHFFANVTHELRTPLALILGVIKSIEQGIKDAQERELIAVAIRNTQHLLNMVHEILYLSKTETVTQRLNYSIVNVADLTQPLVAEYQVIARQKGIKLTYIVEEADMATIWADPQYVGIILANLLSNAIKFTGKNGRVTVNIQKLDDKISITITDNGRGIHPLDLPHIFDRYYQTQLPGAAAEGGTGIGLALARELTEMMQAEITVVSVPGATTFCVLFPYSASSESTVATDGGVGVTSIVDKLPTSTVLENQNSKILIVEDHPDFQFLLKVIFKDLYQIFTAFNGEEALAFLASNPLPDLIICDAMMPVMDGFQLIAKLKKMESYARIPILMLTAKDQAEDKKTAIRLGVDDYLLKPIEQDMLLLMVKTILDRKKIRAQEKNRLFELADSDVAGAELSEKDAAWMDHVEQLLYAGISDPSFSIDKLAQEVLMSRSTFFRKINHLTGLTPHTYVQEARMQQARRMLESGKFDSVKSVAESVGLRDIKYFARQYKQRFGKSISTYAIEY
jgi:signal transduction histidine kinase/DNA-binding NarL/FixJ family response regulator/ligand-binding sensor domain-containing protein